MAVKFRPPAINTIKDDVNPLIVKDPMAHFGGETMATQYI